MPWKTTHMFTKLIYLLVSLATKLQKVIGQRTPVIVADHQDRSYDIPLLEKIEFSQGVNQISKEYLQLVSVSSP